MADVVVGIRNLWVLYFVFAHGRLLFDRPDGADKPEELMAWLAE
jgi:hypothetical protein